MSDGVDMIAALEHFPTYVLCQLLGPEGYQLRFHDLADAGGEVNVAQGVHAPVAGEENGAVPDLGGGKDLLRHRLGPDHDQHAGPHLNDGSLGLGVVAADDDPPGHIVVLELGFLGHGDDADLAVELHLRVVVENFSVQGLPEVFQGRPGHNLNGPGGVVETDDGDVGLGEKADELFMLVYHAAVGSVVLLHLLEGLKDGGVRGGAAGWVHGNLLHGHPGVGEPLGLRKGEPVQQVFGFGVELPQAAGHGADAQRTLEKGVGNGRGHRVRIWMLVTGNVYGGFLHGWLL